MKTWRVVLIVTDDGHDVKQSSIDHPDEDVMCYMDKDEIEDHLQYDWPSGVEVKIESMKEVNNQPC